MATNANPKKLRPWAIALMSNSGGSRLKGRPSKASLVAVDNTNGEINHGSPTASILSLPLFDEPKILDDLPNKIDTGDSVPSKDDQITTLLGQATKLESTLSDMRVEANEHRSDLRSSEEAKRRAEKDLGDLQTRLSALIAEREQHVSVIAGLRRELDESRKKEATKSAELEKIESNIVALQAELDECNTNTIKRGSRVKKLEALLEEERSHHKKVKSEAAKAAEDTYQGRFDILQGELDRLMTALEDKKIKHDAEITELQIAHQRILDDAVRKAKAESESTLRERLQKLTKRQDEGLRMQSTQRGGEVNDKAHKAPRGADAERAREVPNLRGTRQQANHATQGPSSPSAVSTTQQMEPVKNASRSTTQQNGGSSHATQQQSGPGHGRQSATSPVPNVTSQDRHTEQDTGSASRLASSSKRQTENIAQHPSTQKSPVIPEVQKAAPGSPTPQGKLKPASNPSKGEEQVQSVSKGSSPAQHAGTTAGKGETKKQDEGKRRGEAIAWAITGIAFLAASPAGGVLAAAAGVLSVGNAIRRWRRK
ncbi:uncharacterized protein FIBRA_06290 [Fibroporia radiculosa]|uniref:SWI5-dependent HO expression protein 3 n=1 Tax=Fibroporia radiculosa TaxID=599839 RepID=J4H400_9APHY|nr:uncharacterized protein FIBRA_06290 [Fibroporia radiculosa]CCM04129.1 predicted protein [Fibroporia radiculosa]